MKTLSILAPVYNVAPYLRRCLDSVLQAVADVADRCEVILVDDGSTDESAAICDEYARQHPDLITVYRKANEGAYPTRNYAMDKASAAFLWLIDPDDKVQPDAVAQIFETIEKYDDPDIITMRYRRFNNKSAYGGKLNGTKNEGLVTGVNYLTHNVPNAYLWCNVYRAAFLKENELRFNDQLNTQGDWLFNMYAYCKAKRMCLTNIYAYDYFTGNPNSTLRNPNAKHKRRGVANSLLAIYEFHDFIERSTNEPYYKALCDHESITVAGFLYSLYRIKLPAGEVNGILKELRKKGIYPVCYGTNERGNKFLRYANRRWIFVPGCWWHARRDALPKT